MMNFSCATALFKPISPYERQQKSRNINHLTWSVFRDFCLVWKIILIISSKYETISVIFTLVVSIGLILKQHLALKLLYLYSN